MPLSASVGKPTSASTRRTARTARDPSALPSAGSPSASAIALEALGAVAARELERLRDHQPDREPVREVRDAAERLRERVVGRAVGQVHRQAGGEARARHAAARLDVRPVRDRLAQRVRHVVAGLEPEGDRERRGVPHRARADRLRERVDAGVRGRPGGQAMCEDGIDERVLRAHVRVAEAHLAVGVGVGKDARAGDLAAGACGGRAEDEPEAGRLRGCGCRPA